MIWQTTTFSLNANLLIPVLVEGDEVADVAVADVGLLRQHSCHEDVIHPKDPMVAALINLKNILATKGMIVKSKGQRDRGKLCT